MTRQRQIAIGVGIAVTVAIVASFIWYGSFWSTMIHTFVGQPPAQSEQLVCSSLVAEVSEVAPGGQVKLTTAFQPPCVDRDGDGYGENCELGPDCDDWRADIHPDQEDWCNGEDDNCNGQIDEDCQTTQEFYVDQESKGGTCSDTNDGSKTSPFCTIDQGVSQLGPGVTVWVREGTYRVSGVDLRKGQSGEKLKAAKLSAYPNEKVAITSAVVVNEDWEHIGNNVWQHTRDNDLTWDQMFFDGETVFSRYAMADKLKDSNRCRISCDPGELVENSWCTDNSQETDVTKIYTRFPDNTAPTGHDIEITQSDPGDYGNIWLEGSHTFVEGFYIEKMNSALTMDTQAPWKEGSTTESNNVIINNKFSQAERFIASWMNSGGNRIIGNTMENNTSPSCNHFIYSQSTGDVYKDNTIGERSGPRNFGFHDYCEPISKCFNWMGRAVYDNNTVHPNTPNVIIGSNNLIRNNDFGDLIRVGVNIQIFNNIIRSPNGIRIYGSDQSEPKYYPKHFIHHNRFVNPEFDQAVMFDRIDDVQGDPPQADFNSLAKPIDSPDKYWAYYVTKEGGRKSLTWARDRGMELNSVTGPTVDSSCLDQDEDGDPQPSATCTHAFDCQDSDPAINSWAAEICGDDLDNDCDGVIDETECLQGSDPSTGRFQFSAQHGEIQPDRNRPWEALYTARQTDGQLDEVQVEVTDRFNNKSTCKTKIKTTGTETPILCRTIQADRTEVYTSEVANLVAQIEGTQHEDTSFAWQITSGDGEVIRNLAEPWKAIFKAGTSTGTSTVQVVAAGQSSCKIDIVVSTKEPPLMPTCQSLIADDELIFTNQTTALTTTLSNGDPEDSEYSWQVIDGQGSAAADQSQPWKALYEAGDVPGTTTVQVKVDDDTACQTQIVVILPDDEDNDGDDDDDEPEPQYKVYYPYGALIRGQNAQDVRVGPTIYQVGPHGHRHAIPGPAAVFTRYHLDQVVSTNDTVLTDYTAADEPAPYPEGILIKEPQDPTVYWIDFAGRRRPFTSYQTFRELGYNKLNTHLIPTGSLEANALGPAIDSSQQHPSGTLVKTPDNPTVQMIMNDTTNPALGAFYSATAFTLRYNFQEVIIITPEEMEIYHGGGSMGLPPNTLLRTESDPTVYFITPWPMQQRLPIVSEEAFSELGLDRLPMRWVSQTEMEIAPRGEAINYHAVD